MNLPSSEEVSSHFLDAREELITLSLLVSKDRQKYCLFYTMLFQLNNILNNWDSHNNY